MKKRLFLILSVTIMLFAGCGSKDNVLNDMEADKTEMADSTKETDMAGDKEIPDAGQKGKNEAKKRQAEKKTSKKAEPKKEEPEKGHKEAEEPPSPQPVSQPEKKEENEPAQGSTEIPQPEEPQAEEPQPQEPNPEESKPEEPQAEEPQPEEPQPQEQTVAAYDPVSVCNQAIAKCQAGGMVTTTDNLANLLAEGKITQEEYNSYYPYDGLGYYSVFVETDLNKASTTSGRKLGSEDGIADYIAGMMLLETEPVFYIEYAGVYNLNGTDFYEFRCYR
ncbi:MAG: hypothetical protein HFH43_05735 [Lachnospiraceae bacterium]|nr:hypothetical protein [Lachnospiraceae bacterium]